MKNKYMDFKFNTVNIVEDKEYIAHIVYWCIKEDEEGDKFQILAEFYELGATFLFSCKISNRFNSRFYNICNNLCLIQDDGTVDFEILESDCDVICTLSEVQEGTFFISNMWWLDEEDGYEYERE